jgi:hypothetical protein
MILSYTMLNTWLICPHQMARRYIVKDIPYEESAAAKAGNELHAEMEARIKDDLSQFDLLGVEKKLGMTAYAEACDFFDKDVWLRGKADLLVIQDDTACLIDWKSGNVREDPFELEVQALLLKVNYPEVKTIKGRYVWFKPGRLGVEHNLSDTTSTFNKITKLHNEIETGKYKKTPGPLCGYCPVLDCQHNKRAA